MGVTFEPGLRGSRRKEALDRDHGTGTTGSRIANGTYGGHRELERGPGPLHGPRAGIVFSTGYQANLGMIAGWPGPRT